MNIGTFDSANFNNDTFPTTYFDTPYNHSNDAAPTRLYTAVNCITDSTNAVTYVKQFVQLDQTDASSVQLDTSLISTIGHPLNTTIGFD